MTQRPSDAAEDLRLAVAEMMQAGEDYLAYFRKVFDEPRSIASDSGRSDYLGASQNPISERIQTARSVATTPRPLREHSTDSGTTELPPAVRTHRVVTIQSSNRDPFSSSGLRDLPDIFERQRSALATCMAMAPTRGSGVAGGTSPRSMRRSAATRQKCVRTKPGQGVRAGMVELDAPRGEGL